LIEPGTTRNQKPRFLLSGKLRFSMYLHVCLSEADLKWK